MFSKNDLFIRLGKSKFSIFLFCLVIVSLFFNHGSFPVDLQAKNQIYSVSLENNNLVIKYKNQGETKILFSVFQLDSLKNKSNKRLVIDLKNTTLTSKKVKDISLKNFEIRIAQFNKNTVRVVLESLDTRISKVKLDSNFKDKFLIITNSVLSGKSDQLSQLISLKNKSVFISENKKHQIFFKINRTEYLKFKTKIFKLESPKRLILDIENYKYSDLEELKQKSFKFKLIEKIRIGKPFPEKNISRIVFEFKQQSDFSYSTYQELNNKQQENFFVLKISPTHLSKKNSALQTKIKQTKIMIDPGHGGYDHGASHSEIKEKELNLAIANKLAERLKKQGFKVIQVRSKDSYVSLQERVKLTKLNKPDVFISLHCNALNSNKKIYGIETYYYTTQSLLLAQLLHKNLLKNTKSKDRRIRKARFVVIRETDIPSVLLELGFLTNPHERKKLNSPGYQEKIILAIENGILEYLKN